MVKRGDIVPYYQVKPCQRERLGRIDMVNEYSGTVKVMAVADNYAMVRRPRCMPFVVSLSDIERWRCLDDQ